MDCYSLAIAVRDVDEAESGRSSIINHGNHFWTLCEFGHRIRLAPVFAI
jgi:hypothetical protein